MCNHEKFMLGDICKMKKIFDKLNKVIFVAGIAAMVIMVLILSNWLSAFGDDITGIIMMICICVACVFVVFAAISVVLATIDGFKKDKTAFLKKFISNIVLITIAYIVVFVLDYFHVAELPMDLNLGKVVLQIVVCALAIIGGEYMITDHSKEKKD